jgi:hypothetical protein
MRTNHGIRKVLHRESNKSHQRSLAARGSKCRIKVKNADGKCTRMHKRSKREIECLEPVTSTLKGSDK